ncbi:MAG TPA: hypothetical protein DG577_03575 [Firmicutes bacterium]|nr:hypothetical protein [Bacillota bacterium]
MKRWLALLLVVLMVFSLTACGGGKDDDTKTPGGNTEDPGGTENPGGTEDPGDNSLEGEFYILEDQMGVFNLFKELSFSYKALTEGEEEAFTYSHQYLDSEVVDYVMEEESHSDNAKHFQIKIAEDGAENVFEAWVNDAGTIVKAGNEEGYATGDMAALTTVGFIFHLIPFYVYNEVYTEVFTSEGGFAKSGWDVKEHSTGSKDFGSGNVRVEKYKFAWSWTKDIIDWEVAEINGRYIFTHWKMIEEEGDTMELFINKIIPF